MEKPEDIIKNPVTLEFVGLKPDASYSESNLESAIIGKLQELLLGTMPQWHYWIDKLTGTDEVRLQIEEGLSAEEIKAGWQDEINLFLEQRRPYLLYEE